MTTTTKTPATDTIVLLAIEEVLVSTLASLDKLLTVGKGVDKDAIILSGLTRAIYDRMVEKLKENPEQTRTMMLMMMTELVMTAAEEACEKREEQA